MKFILVTGGVISGIGKGVSSSSLGHLLQCHGYNITMIKIDPYLNIDAGTISPFEHGEVFVLDDGTETDLDLGTYERMLNIRLSHNHSITTGRVYHNVLSAERRGDYLGKTVQVVPHITDEIIYEIIEASEILVEQKTPDICIIELGGTVGDIESMPFIEALRQLRFRVGKENFCHIHMSLIPIVKEQKSKPTQHSFKELRSVGLSPDFICCRCEEPVQDEIKDKISLFCMVPKERVISLHDVSSIYKVPSLLLDQNVPILVLNRLKLFVNPSPITHSFILQEYNDPVSIAIVGKYMKIKDSYLSLTNALIHSAHFIKRKLNIIWIDSENINLEQLKQAQCIIIPGGFGNRGLDGKIFACKYARENKIPFLGICLGFQIAVIEYCRNVLGWENANSQEFNNNPDSVIVNMQDCKELGGTMRLGLKTIELSNRFADIYGDYTIKERYRHRYEINPKYAKDIATNGLLWSGISDGRISALELDNHPYYVAVQYHPEFLSRITSPPKLFIELMYHTIKNS